MLHLGWAHDNVAGREGHLDRVVASAERPVAELPALEGAVAEERDAEE